jgi:NAD(P)-dependent dehydrogenase (short-subunit alcohol dehydrogenase family)
MRTEKPLGFEIDRLTLRGRVALVTGASRGLGREIALGLARAGADLALVARSEEALREVASQVEEVGRRALVCPGDISREEDVARIADAAEGGLGRVDVLVNNAGLAESMTSTEAVSLETWNRVIGVNLTGPFLLCRRLGPPMVGRKQGSIVNVGSILGEVGMRRALVYCASKGGLAAMTRALAAEWARDGVRVNLLAPGFIETNMTAEYQENEKALASLQRRTMMNRLGTADEVVGATVFLASDAASYITGTTLFVDGGWTAS